MNTFEYTISINEKSYYIYIDSSTDKNKIIKINGIEVINDKCSTMSNYEGYIIYYTIELENTTIVVSIDDSPVFHEYNIYLNGFSVTDGSELNKQYNVSQKEISNGFWSFFKNNWTKVLKENLLEYFGWLATSAIIWGYTTKKIEILTILIPLFSIFTLPVFVIAEWYHNKNIVKKYKACFRKTVSLKLLGDGSLRSQKTGDG